MGEAVLAVKVQSLNIAEPLLLPPTFTPPPSVPSSFSCNQSRQMLLPIISLSCHAHEATFAVKLQLLNECALTLETSMAPPSDATSISYRVSCKHKNKNRTVTRTSSGIAREGAVAERSRSAYAAEVNSSPVYSRDTAHSQLRNHFDRSCRCGVFLTYLNLYWS